MRLWQAREGNIKGVEEKGSKGKGRKWGGREEKEVDIAEPCPGLTCGQAGTG